MSRRQAKLQVQLNYSPSPGGLNLLVDSTGIKYLGERVMARTFERPVVALHVRVALLHRFNQIGRPMTVAVA